MACPSDHQAVIKYFQLYQAILALLTTSHPLSLSLCLPSLYTLPPFFSTLHPFLFYPPSLSFLTSLPFFFPLSSLSLYFPFILFPLSLDSSVLSFFLFSFFSLPLISCPHTSFLLFCPFPRHLFPHMLFPPPIRFPLSPLQPFPFISFPSLPFPLLFLSPFLTFSSYLLLPFPFAFSPLSISPCSLA